MSEGDSPPVDPREGLRPPAVPPATPVGAKGPVPSTTAGAGDDATRGMAAGFFAPASAARELAVDLVKLFITFATAGIAFLVGAVFSGKIALSALTIIACLVLFAASAVCGILFIMQAVSGVHDGSYDVTAPSPTWIAFVQMVLFFLGAGWLGWQAVERAGAPVAPSATTQIEIHATAGRWTVDSAGGIAIHKDRGSRDSGAASLRVRATSDGLMLRIELDTQTTRAAGAPSARPR